MTGAGTGGIGEDNPSRNVSIARAAYDAYVTKDQAAIEKLLAKDFHFTSPATIDSIARRTSGAAGRTASSLAGSTSSTSLPMPIACSSPMKGRTPMVIDFATRRSLRSEVSSSSMSRCTSAGQCHTRRREEGSWTKARDAMTTEWIDTTRVTHGT